MKSANGAEVPHTRGFAASRLGLKTFAETVLLLQKAMILLRPVFTEFIEKGYTLDDIAQQVHQAVDFVKRN